MVEFYAPPEHAPVEMIVQLFTFMKINNDSRLNVGIHLC